MSLIAFLSVSVSLSAKQLVETSQTAVLADFEVKGTVVDKGGDPIEGAFITIKNGSNTVRSEANGNFKLNCSSPKAVFIVSAPGFIQQTVYVDGRQALEIILKKDIDRDGPRDETYVLFGKQKKDLVSGAVSQIYGNEVENRGAINNRTRLTGMLSGLFGMQNNGEPGDEGTSLWIRGKRTFRSKSPIVLIDGYERSMDLLDPNEIEAITVLKDAASTARYGLRGSNGIVQVTTRRGTVGKVQVKVNMRAGLKSPTTTPQLLDSYDYASLYNEATRNDNLNAKLPYSETYLNKYMNARKGTLEDPADAYLYPNINWYDQFTKPATWQQRYSLSLQGGSDFVKYFVSGGYVNNSGMYNVDKAINTYNTNAKQDMITIRSNLDIQVTKRFTVSLDLNGRQEQRTWPGSRSDAALNLFRAFYKTPPNAFPVFQKGVDNATGLQMLGGSKDYPSNPYGMLNRSGYSLSLIRYMAATLKLKHDLDFITKGLSVLGEFAFDSWYEMNTNRSKTYSVFGIDVDADGQPRYKENESKYYIKTGTDSQMSNTGDYPGTTRALNYRLGFDYSRTFGQHSVFAEVLFNQREIAQDINDLPRIYRGWDARISYNYKQRYLADFNLGIMGSEQFLKSNRYGVFPALSLGWILSEESFLRNNPIVSFLKVRASAGVTGWDDTGGYFLWYQKFGSSSGTNFGQTAIGVTGWNESAFALNNVTWEKNRQFNVGLDARFLKDKINLSFDYFNEDNKDIMCQPELPYLMGIRFPDMPLGRVKNQGLDLSLGYQDTFGDFQFGISGVLSYSKNNIVEMGEATKTYPYQMKTGRPLDAQFGLVALGLFQSEEEITASPVQTYTNKVNPGDIKYLDVNNDRVIDDYDRIYLGTNADPYIQGGVQLNLAWKGFDFNVLFTAQDGGNVYLSGESIWEFHNNGTVRDHHLGRFNPSDESTWATATYPRLSLSNKIGNQQQSTYWSKSTAQARLKNIEIGYNFPVKWSRNVINKLRLYANGYNLLTWQSTDLIDVESRSSHYVQYPIQKIINFGINVTF